MYLILRATNHVDAEVRAQRFGHYHAAVGLLVAFKKNPYEQR